MSELPTGWGFSSLLDIVNLHDSRRIPLNQKQRAERQGEYPYYGANGQVDSIDDFIFDGNYILLAEDGGYFDNPSKGVAYEVSGQFWVNNHAHILSPCGEIPIRFLSYVLNSLDWMPYVGGSTRLKLTQESMRRVLIPLPPLNEQRRIVAKLDRLFARSRCAREELGQVSGLVQRYKQAVLATAFRGDLTADWREENNLPKSSILRSTINDPYKHDFFAPEHWKSYYLVQVCKFIGGSQPPKSMFSYTPKPGYLRLIQIRDYKSDAFITYVPRESVRRFCSAADVMIGRYGPPIFQILRGIEGAYNVALMKAEANLEITSKKFIYYYLQNPDLFNYVDVSSDRTAGQSGVNKAHLEKYPVFMPPLEEQTVIVQIIEKLFKAIDFMEQEHQQASKLLDRLEQATLSKAFRGELVPQDPNDEPAAVLLERIQSDRQAQPKGKAIKSKQSHC